MTPTTRPRAHRLAASVALVLLLAGGAAACSGSGSDDAAKTTTTDAPTRTTVTAKGSEGTTEEDPTVTTDDGETTTTEAADDGDRSKQAYVDAFAKGFDSTEELIPAAKSQCVGEKLIDVLGFDAIVDSGLTPEEFGQGNGDDFPKSLGIDEDKANEMYDQFEACDVNLGEAFVKALSGEGTFTAEQKACLTQKVTDDTLRASFVASFLGDDSGDDPLDAATECVGGDDSPTANTVAPLTPSTVG
ncbi:hypothetical protein BH10ACT1_BH10ACT1_24590 [soil metagenome]